MDIKAFLSDWIEISNSYNTPKYLELYLNNAVLDDPSVGSTFSGHDGIREYYERYFIGYNTQTTLLKLDVHQNTAYMEVSFKGSFPGGQINGMFDFVFKDGKIASVKADLI